ncbi:MULTISPECIES: methyl-accepting chemotaxis protein [unclassified Pseudoalteromonas]|uniref:methyl-accepting chemotaxis protein n=1 Tax=unclassified Pseudoalteromonas TaxID=194690 RepID=UPI0005A864EB|nr:MULTISPECIES: methyl-accepting chemotaxis protein [unclassified Pseudoalteromonas]
MKQNRRNSELINEEVLFEDNEELVSTTDLRGVTTYANDIFCQIAGYEESELIGKNHNIVRHPDMPAAAFKDMWDHLKQGNSWRGVVKNKCKDGRYYWVDAYVTPIIENGKVTGYQSVRVKPSEQLKQTAQKAYDKINKGDLSGVSELTTSKKQIISLNVIGLLSFLFAYKFGFLAMGMFIFSLVILAIIFRGELVQTPQKILQLQNDFDSVSRFIYFGKGMTSVINFHLGLHQAKVRTILGRFVDLSKNLQQVGHKLDSTSNQAQESIENQKCELNQIAAAMDQMAASTSEIAQNSAETLNKVEETSSICVEANQLIETSSQKIDKLSEDVLSTASSADGLKVEISKVNDMMNEINGIAEQTNLLALNAAIEAARAGEQGRGFAVVADEVRSLSTRTQKSSEEIQSSISSMVKTIENWTAVMELNVLQAKECNDSTSSSQQLMAQINEMMNEVIDYSSHIATAAQEQGAVADDINHNVRTVNELSEESLNNANIVAQNAHEISQALDYIETVSNTFKD